MSGRPTYLLDTNIISDLIRNPQGAVANRIAAVGEDSIATSIVVAAELRYGAAKSGGSKLADRVELLLSAMEVLPLDSPTDRRYAQLRDDLTRQGMVIGPNDLLIAAHALAEELTLVTDNVREFSRVSTLAVENWLRQ
ncbi:MAG: type II toxin-antitoxin system VapC family toxin [Wenzhouxiangella sp.]|nr:MAG: type II toxin-antitoxin system VapC family toxin [Wenzhouxiangella sp.]